MTQIELFAGIGGFGLAGEMAGIETVAQVEWDLYCQKVLNKNFPNAKKYGNIKEVDFTQYRGSVDIISGGFPCQPFSSAGNRKGTDDDRYLWPEMLRAIREVRPSWVIGENVSGILSMDNGAVFEDICTSLENEGYTVQAFVIPACAVEAPHRRDRVWIVANSKINKTNTGRKQGVQTKPTNDNRQVTAYARREGLQRGEQSGTLSKGARTPRPITKCNSTTPNAKGTEQEFTWDTWARREGLTDGDTSVWRIEWPKVAASLCRVDDGIPSWVDRHRTNRLKALGNAIVPQVAYQIFKEIVDLCK